MATAYYRPPEKRTTEKDTMAQYYGERHKWLPREYGLAVGVTVHGRTELLRRSEAEDLILELRAAIDIPEPV